MLEVKDLRKEYGPLLAANNVSFTLQPGDIFGFIGSNGAGKTTTIKMIATLLEPTSGTAVVNGADILKQPMEVRRQIGYMPDFFGVYDDLKVWEYLDFFAAIYSVEPRDRPKIIDQVLELTNLTVKKHDFVQSLSRGMQQRLCLARCLVHDPMLLLLDEPASGLDPRARAELKELIIELGRMGKIVIVSSHILPELADFCNTVGIIERGNLVACGSVASITRQLQQSRSVSVRFLERAHEAGILLRELPFVTEVVVTSETALSIEVQGDHDELVVALTRLIEAGHKVWEFKEHQANLEDVFLKLTTGAVN